MKVVVVGGTGNISVSIVRLLLEQGHDVVCFNRGQRGGLPDGARHLRGDRHDRPAFEQAMRAEKPDAAIDMIGFTADDARSCLAAFRGVRHFVHCSTVCTYGVSYDRLPVTEDHPLRPISDYGRDKQAADAVYLAAWHAEGFPVTVLKPSTTYGPQMGLLRQVAWEFTWIDRMRRGKPLAVCGDGLAAHQFLHVDDAAPAFVFCLGRERCLGQVYNVVGPGHVTWADHHRTAMGVVGREVELVGVPLHTLIRAGVPSVEICRDIFAHTCVYSGDRLRRDVPEFSPRIGLAEGMARVLESMDREGRVPPAEENTWEDALVAAQLAVGGAAP